MVLLLTIIGGFLVFLDFCLGEALQRKLKDRLVDAYVAIAEGSWQKLIHNASKYTDAFLSRIFGADIFGGRTLFRYAIFSIAFNATLSLVFLFNKVGREMGARILIDSAFWPIAGTVLFSNVVADTAVASLARQIVRRIAGATIAAALAWLFCLIALTYLATSSLIALSAPTAVLMMLSASNSFTTVSENDWQLWKLLFLTWAPGAFEHPWISGISIAAYNRLVVFVKLAEAKDVGMNFFYFTVSAIVPALIQWTLMALAVGIVVLRPLLQKPFTLLLARLEANKLGVLTLVGGAVGAVAGVIKLTS
jgi:hypothetical protein